MQSLPAPLSTLPSHRNPNKQQHMAATTHYTPLNNDIAERNISDLANPILNEPEDFVDTFEHSEQDCTALFAQNQYCAQWNMESKLHILRPNMVERAFEREHEAGLFHMFLNKSFFECVRQWTSIRLKKRGQLTRSLLPDELYAYIGLELATSISKLNELDDYWNSKVFLGQEDFKRVMPRDLFRNIRSSLQLYPNYDPEIATVDPLWHSRVMLEHFTRNASNVAVPFGVTSLDENTVRCKGRTSARCYMKSKPVKFGIRFYAVVGWRYAYLHSLADNGSGNRTGVSPANRYTTVFRKLRGVFKRKQDNKLVGKTSASALWCLQLTHQTLMKKAPQGRRLAVMDNFYTRHTLATQLAMFTDNEIRVLGTVRINNVDSVNRPSLNTAIERIKNSPRSSWLLVQVFKSKGNSTNSNEIAKNCGFVVFKDRATVVFYSNDLASTPTSPIQEPDDHAIHCVHGLAPLERWFGEEALHRTTVFVPAVIVAYNLFMNSVDRFDQVRSTNATCRKEQRVPMSLFTFLLDASVQNAYAIQQAIPNASGPQPTVREFKRRIAEAFVVPLVERNVRRRTLIPVTSTQTNHEIAPHLESSTHMLLENNAKKSVQCFLCKVTSPKGKASKSIYSCAACRYSFHVNCFAFFHNREEMKRKRPHIAAIVEEGLQTISERGLRHRKNMCSTDLSTTPVPFTQ